MITVSKDAIMYKDSEGNMQSAGVLCNVGTFGVNTFKYAKTFRALFTGVTFDVDEIEIDCLNDLGIKVESMENVFLNSKNLKKVTIKANMAENVGNLNGFTMYQAFSKSELEVIDLSGVTPLFPYNINYLVYNCSNLREIIGEFDLSNHETAVSAYSFLGATALEEIRIKKETLYYSISFASCSKLSDASIQSIIDGLATVETSQTLTLHADVKSKLTENQIVQITSKNWTLA